METPKLPPKPSRNLGSRRTIKAEVRLPDKCEMLSVRELGELVEAREKLELFCSKFIDGTDVIQEVVCCKEELEQLEHEYDLLEERRKAAQDKLDEYHRLEFQYCDKWRLLDEMMKENFSESALKNLMRSKLRELKEVSRDLGSRKDVADLDAFIAEYVNVRTAYHLHNEKLETWESQDSLQK